MRCPREEVERLDAELVSLARVEGALRLRLGQVLEVLGRGACFELGFSSLAAYVLERCDRSVRWAEGARCLARRVERLPELRRAMAAGNVSWSMGELLARVAQPEDEARWIECAESRTVRQVRVLVMEALSQARDACSAKSEEHAARAPTTEPADNGGSDEGDSDEGDSDEGDSDDAMCTLTCTVDQGDVWLFEATRALLGQLGVHGSHAECEALLAEAQGTLLAALPEGALDGERWEWQETDQQRWVTELARWRAEAEALCEGHIRSSRRGSGEPELHGEVAAAAQGLASLEGAGGAELDGNVRRLARTLARRELELARALLRFHRADGWRRLGYATETQYARERLGLSRASVLAKRALALRLEKLPCVAGALEVGQLGIEAAVQLARVATPRTEVAWVERACRRTIKHLREEVAAALTAVRLSGEADCPPPTEAELVAFEELEQAVVSGRACQTRPASNPDVARAVADARRVDTTRLPEHVSAERRAWLEMLGSLATWLESGLQSSAVQLSAARRKAGASSGRIQLRLRMSRATYAWWRGLEARARRWLPCGMSWLRFLCLASWQAWRHLLGADMAYGQIYIRDRFRCTSPVCSRRDVTPHHLQFRSAGGSDDDDNVAAVCSWCHLQGVHGGRIRARGTARDIRWELGALGDPCLVVQGRARVAA